MIVLDYRHCPLDPKVKTLIAVCSDVHGHVVMTVDKEMNQVDKVQTTSEMNIADNTTDNLNSATSNVDAYAEMGTKTVVDTDTWDTKRENINKEASPDMAVSAVEEEVVQIITSDSQEFNQESMMTVDSEGQESIQEITWEESQIDKSVVVPTPLGMNYCEHSDREGKEKQKKKKNKLPSKVRRSGRLMGTEAITILEKAENRAAVKSLEEVIPLQGGGCLLL